MGGDLNDRDFTADGSSTGEITYLMDTLKTNFIDKGIPVMIGEFGARNKNNIYARAEWVSYYITRAKELGRPCIWWDNGAFDGDGENFGFLDREKNLFKYDDILFAMMEALK